MFLTSLYVTFSSTVRMRLINRLMLAILLLAAEKHKATFIAPIGIGLALFVRISITSTQTRADM